MLTSNKVGIFIETLLFLKDFFKIRTGAKYFIAIYQFYYYFFAKLSGR